MKKYYLSSLKNYNQYLDGSFVDNNKNPNKTKSNNKSVISNNSLDMEIFKEYLNNNKKKKYSKGFCNCNQSKCKNNYCSCKINNKLCHKKCKCSKCFNKPISKYNIELFKL